MTDQPAQALRHVTLDALRGFAVMGILAMNIVAFAMPDMAYVTPAAYGGDTLSDLATYVLAFIFVDGKMRGLFSLLFGASMLLVIEAAERKGESGKSVHFRRMGWLAIFGLAHFFFLWFGDILFLYAAVGSFAFLFRNWEPRRLIKWALGIFTVGTIIWGMVFGGMIYLKHAAAQPDAPASVVKQYQDMINSPDFSTAGVREDLKVHRGSYADIVADKWENQKFQPLIFIFQVAYETLPLMMLGMALFKNGFLLGQWEPVRYRRLALLLVPPGLLLTALIAWVLARQDFHVIYAINATFSWAGPPRLALTIGYACLFILLIQRLAGTAFLARVTAAGRAAFTNYLGTSIVMTTIFYGYGLGLYGSVGRAEQWLFVIGAWAVMLIWSKPWLDRFQYGPLEWLWRSLARGSLQPMRR